MKKNIKIEGMSCEHCRKHVEKALNAIAGLTARVDLGAKTAYTVTDGSVSDEALKKAIEDAGYEAVEIFCEE